MLRRLSWFAFLVTAVGVGGGLLLQAFPDRRITALAFSISVVVGMTLGVIVYSFWRRKRRPGVLIRWYELLCFAAVLSRLLELLGPEVYWVAGGFGLAHFVALRLSLWLPDSSCQSDE